MNRYGMPYEGQYGSPLTNRHDRMLSHQPAMPMPMLLPLPPVSMVMNAMFPMEIQRQRQKKRKEQNLEYYEKFIVNQNNNLRKVAKVINRQFGEVFDISTNHILFPIVLPVLYSCYKGQSNSLKT